MEAGDAKPVEQNSKSSVKSVEELAKLLCEIGISIGWSYNVHTAKAVAQRILSQVALPKVEITPEMLEAASHEGNVRAVIGEHYFREFAAALNHRLQKMLETREHRVDERKKEG